HFVFCSVFFFQAEDGIRDGHVTGVQTCALPIFPGRLRRRSANPSVPGSYDVHHKHPPSTTQNRPEKRPSLVRSVRPPPTPRPPRSEERRVGKECRTGRRREH